MNTQHNTNELKTSREEAKAAGDAQYAGSPCIHGHDGRRYTSSGICATCKRMRSAGQVPDGGWHKRRPAGVPLTLDFIRSNCIEDPASGCWLWQRSTNEDGYGSIFHQGRSTLAHRLAFELSGGVVPEGLYVLHSCDRPACCSPDHLSVGTQFENMAEMFSRGRGRRACGEASPRAVLTEDQLVRIRGMLPYRSLAEIAAEFGVTISTIHSIKAGTSWAHVPIDPSVPVIPVKPRQPIEQVAQIKAQLAAGRSVAGLAEEFGLTRHLVSRIDRGKRWKHVQPATDSEAA